MTIQLDNLTLGGSKYVLSPPIEGMLIPDIRTSSGLYSGRDGGFVSAQNYSPRQIVINGMIVGNSCQEYESLNCQFLDTIKARNDIDFTFTTNTGNKYFTQVNVLDLQYDVTNGRIGEYQLTLIAPDPYFYFIGDGTTGEGWISQDLFRLVSGGYETEYILPVEWDFGGTPTVITNSTDINVYPVITLTGTYTNPIIQNITTGALIKINATTASSDVLEIDMYNRTVTLNGGSILASVDAYSSWWYLQPGTNNISLTSGSGGDDDTVTIKYRIPFEGIFSGECS